MANSKLTDLTVTTTPALTDRLYIVTDPTGTPVDHGVSNQSLADLYLSNRMLFVATADKTIANSNAETSLIGTGVGSMTLAAGYFNTAGRSLLLKGSGFISTTGTPTVNIKLKLGSTVICATGAVATASGLALALLSFDILLTCRTTGVTGTVIASGYVGLGTTMNVLYPTGGTTSTVDTTGTLAADVTETWGAADPANTLSIVNFTLQKLN